MGIVVVSSTRALGFDPRFEHVIDNALVDAFVEKSSDLSRLEIVYGAGLIDLGDDLFGLLAVPGQRDNLFGRHRSESLDGVAAAEKRDREEPEETTPGVQLLYLCSFCIACHRVASDGMHDPPSAVY